ncbi:MAG: Holliday junction resolvase RuvX [Burkholderiaceae bacterium]
MPSETLLAFDVGARRIGVAVGNELVRQARAAAIVNVTDRDDGFAAIARLVDEWRPERLVVGIPLSVDADIKDHKPSPALARCERFIDHLSRRFGLPVARVDERYSSIDADTLHRERRQAGLAKRAKALDDVAAQVILQRYFDALPVREALA